MSKKVATTKKVAPAKKVPIAKKAAHAKKVASTKTAGLPPKARKSTYCFDGAGDLDPTKTKGGKPEIR